MLAKTAEFCVRHRLVVLLFWILILAGSFVLSSSLGPRYSNEFRLPHSESREAFEVLQSEFPDFKGEPVQIVFRSESGVFDPATKEEMQALFDRVKAFPYVSSVRSPYEGQGAVSKDQKVAFATIEFDREPTQIPREAIASLRDTIIEKSRPGMEVEAGGMAISRADMPELGSAEIVGLIVAVLVMLVGFGSFIATGLPIITALFTLATAISLIVGLSHAMTVPMFAPELARMIGIGVGIDYALLVVTRFRQNLHSGAGPTESAVGAIATAGRSVLFAGAIVAISLLGLAVMGLDFVNGMALSAGISVVLAIAVSLTLLPVALVTLGSKIDALRIPIFSRDESNYRKSWSYRWSRTVQRRPWAAAIVSGAALLLLALPTLSLDLGASDLGNVPRSKTQRRAYDLLSDAFGPGFNAPVLVVIRTPQAESLAQETPQQIQGIQPESGPGNDLGTQDQRIAPALQEERRLERVPVPLPSSVESVHGSVASIPGVAQVTRPMPAPSGKAYLFQVIPSTSPQDSQTRQLIHFIRSLAADNRARGGPEVLVGGLTAAFVDLSDYLSQRLVWLIGGVVALSFFLLMVVFRSLLVPLKAAVMNVLSIGAAYGVVVAIFQWGWMKDLVGVEKPGPIEPFIPMMMFAILFGLSMDYEVFLISRIREEYDKSEDPKSSVADGLAATARVISAAAAIMVAVFLSFVWNDNRIIKLFGLGLATAIFVDATMVRLVLVPSTMELLGKANWWLPPWLDRVLPKISVEAKSDDSDSENREASQVALNDAIPEPERSTQSQSKVRAETTSGLGGP
ncbi:MAG: hypothetical protein C4318_06390 [Acidimicrobiia bacterium]